MRVTGQLIANWTLGLVAPGSIPRQKLYLRDTLIGFKSPYYMREKSRISSEGV